MTTLEAFKIILSSRLGNAMGTFFLPHPSWPTINLLEHLCLAAMFLSNPGRYSVSANLEWGERGQFC